MHTAPRPDGPELISTHVAGRRERRVVRAAFVLSMLLFAISVPFATLPMPALPVFVAIYDAALFIIYLITAILLYGHAGTRRSVALLVLADGFLFVSAMIVPHLLTYPDVFAPHGLLGADIQTTAWLFQFWHLGLPLCVIGYVRIVPRESRTGTRARRFGRTMRRHAGVTLGLVVLLGLLALDAGHWLPTIMSDRIGYARWMPWVVGGVWLVNVVALRLLALKQPRSSLDLWLMVTLVAWLLEVALVAMFNGGRYDLGFYVGRVHGLLAACMVLAALVIENGRLHAHLGRAHERVRQKAQQLERMNATDALTGIANRRLFDDTLQREWLRTLRSGRPLSLLMVDVDHFKAFNDHYGHPGGDRCLREVAQALRGCTRRASDLVARYGGEEFALLLPDTGEADASTIARNACARVHALCIPHDDSPVNAHVTISVGMSTFLPPKVFIGRLAAQPACLVDAADQALYDAKLQGRNRVVVFFGQPACAGL